MKEIPLTQGKVALVDDEDFEYLNQWKWYFHKSGYATRNSNTINGKRQTIYMHKVALKPKEGMETDHINLNKLDNRKQNLRRCTPSENCNNKSVRSDSSSGVKGVGLHKQSGKWQAKIKIGSKRISLGLFEKIEDARKAYDAEAKINFGNFARINEKETE